MASNTTSTTPRRAGSGADEQRLLAAAREGDQAAFERLPANQRAVLILRDVLELSAAEAAEVLDTTVASVSSALQRARKTVDRRIVDGTQAGELLALGQRRRDDLVAAFVAAWDRADVGALLDLLTEDAHFTMPPFPAWFRGKADIGRFLSERVFEVERRARPAVASGQLALACYRHDPGSGRFLLDALNVLSLRDGRIAAMNAFLDPATLRWFDLPEEWVEPEGTGPAGGPTGGQIDGQIDGSAVER